MITEKRLSKLVDKKVNDNKKTLPDGRVVVGDVAISDNDDDSLAAYSLI